MSANRWPPMSDSPVNDPVRAARTGVWRGVAGCFLTAAATVLGAGLGLWSGWLLLPPKWDPMKGGSEFHGLSVDFDRLAYLVVGCFGGGLVGIIAGVSLSVMLLRRRKPKPAGWPCLSASRSAGCYRVRPELRNWDGWHGLPARAVGPLARRKGSSPAEPEPSNFGAQPPLLPQGTLPRGAGRLPVPPAAWSGRLRSSWAR